MKENPNQLLPPKNIDKQLMKSSQGQPNPEKNIEDFAKLLIRCQCYKKTFLYCQSEQVLGTSELVEFLSLSNGSCTHVIFPASFAGQGVSIRIVLLSWMELNHPLIIKIFVKIYEFNKLEKFINRSQHKYISS
jgi:hypothetical protein